jgi:hypothetical protein
VFVLQWIEGHLGTAAWVQAIGAILALAVAIFVPVWMARKADHLSRRRFLESVSAIANEVHACFLFAAARCNAGAEEGLLFVSSVNAFHRFRILSSAVNAIPLHQLPTYEVTKSVLELQAMMAEGLMQLDAAFNEVGAHQQLVQAAAFGHAFDLLTERSRPERDCILKASEAT